LLARDRTIAGSCFRTPWGQITDSVRYCWTVSLKALRSPAKFIPLAAALIAFSVTVLRLPTLLDATFRFSDAPELAAIAHAIQSGHGPQNLPTQTSLAVVLLDQAIYGLPFHRFLELATGPVLSLLSFLIMVRTAFLAAGRRAAVGTTLILLVLPPVVLWPLLFPDNHITTVLGAALLAWFVVRSSRVRTRFPLSATLGLLLGILFISDPQLLVVGIIPFIVCVFLQLKRRANFGVRPHVILLLSMGVGIVAGRAIMAAEGITYIQIGLAPATSNIPSSLSKAFKGVLLATNGAWYGDLLTIVFIPAFLLVIAIIVALLVLASQTIRTLLSTTVAQPEPQLLLYKSFWILSASGLLAAFAILGYGSDDDYQIHYLMPLYLAVAALLPVAKLLWNRKFMFVVPALFSIFALNIAFRTATIDPSNFNRHLSPASNIDPLPTLESHHLTYGYSGYWEAYDLTWRSNETIAVWPYSAGSKACDGMTASFCPYSFAPQGEFKGKHSGPSFILTPGAGGTCLPSMPPESVFGTPIAVYRHGPYTISVYDYDVASRFTADKGLFC
jgi:hypothetical protein